jgi:hypothetical protein
VANQPTDDENDDLELALARSTRQPGTRQRRPPRDWRWRSNTFVPRLPDMGLYEHRDEEPLSQWRFLLRMVRHAGVAVVIVAGSLGFGMWGYHRFARFTWIDSFMNSAMLLGGMGPVGDVPTRSGKLFAGFFALYCGMVFLVLIATILTPVVHRVLHRFHWDADRRRANAGRRKLE